MNKINIRNIIISATLSITSLIMPIFAHAVVTPGLVAQWKFDEGSGLIAHDETVNQNDGTLIGGLTWGNGKLGQALKFNGSGYVATPYSPPSNTLFTVSMWIKADPALGSSRILTISDKLEFITSGNNIYFGASASSIANPNGGTYISANLPKGQWVYITGTWDGTNAALYENGLLVNSASGGNGNSEGVIGTTIGQGFSSYADFTGLLDEVAIYERVLPVEEISVLYGSYPPPLVCGATITQNTTLDSDMSCPQTAVTIGANDVTLDCAGYTMTGAGSGYGVYVPGKSGVTVKNCSIKSFGGNGILFGEGSSNGTIINNNVSSNLGFGIQLYYTSNSSVANNTTTSNGGSGLHFGSSSGNTVTGNTSNLNGNAGIEMIGSSNNAVSNNNASSNFNGITLSASSLNNILNSNTTDSNNLFGISMQGGSNGNNLSLNSASLNQYGIYLNQSSSNTVANNTTNSNTHSGIDIYYNSDSNNITSNTANSNGIHGISFDLASAYNAVNLNTANLNGSSGITTNASSFNTFTSNTTNSNGEYGIFINSAAVDTVITSNTVSSNATYGIFLNVSTNGRVASNTVSLSGEAGINISSGSNNSVTGNTVSLTTKDGIFLNATNNNTLTGNEVTNNKRCMKLSYSNGNNLKNNICKFNRRGIVSDPSSNNIIDSNNIEDTDEMAIFLDQSTNDSATNNTITNAFTGIVVSGATGSNVSGNTIRNSQNVATVLASVNTVISGNILENNVNNLLMTDASSVGSLISDIAYAPDSDGDGLPDQQEAVLGTNSANVDTDADALNDGKEVFAYGTNPLAADTDGDNFSDGDEVTQGTDPRDAQSHPDILDADADGLNDDVDSCPAVAGLAEYNGCPFADKTVVTLKINDKSKSGICGTNKKGKPLEECTQPLPGATVKIFDRDNADLIAQYGKRPKASMYGQVFESDLGLVGSCVTDLSGSCIAGEDHAGHFLVIAQFVDDNGVALYQGKLKNFKNSLIKNSDQEDNDDEDSDKDKDAAAPAKGTMITKKLKFEETITKSGTYKYHTLQQGETLWALVLENMGKPANTDEVKNACKEVAKTNGIRVPEWGIKGTLSAQNLTAGMLINISSLVKSLKKE